jgi:transcriptional regulator with XRE-family HTH domain
MELLRAFGEKVRDHRKAAGLSIRGLATRCRLSSSTISKTELATRGEPSLSLILVLRAGLAISPDVLLGDLPIPPRRR